VRQRAGTGMGKRNGPRWSLSLTDPSMLESR